VIRLRAGRSSIPSGGREVFILFVTAFRPALEHTQPPIQQVLGDTSPRAKEPGREGDNSPPSSTQIKNAWEYSSTPPYVFKAWYLRHTDIFTVYFTTLLLLLIITIIIIIIIIIIHELGSTLFRYHNLRLKGLPLSSYSLLFVVKSLYDVRRTVQTMKIPHFL